MHDWICFHGLLFTILCLVILWFLVWRFVHGLGEAIGYVDKKSERRMDDVALPWDILKMIENFEIGTGINSRIVWGEVHYCQWQEGWQNAEKNDFQFKALPNAFHPEALLVILRRVRGLRTTLETDQFSWRSWGFHSTASILRPWRMLA